jgi:hypothetical protein
MKMRKMPGDTRQDHAREGNIRRDRAREREVRKTQNKTQNWVRWCRVVSGRDGSDEMGSYQVGSCGDVQMKMRRMPGATTQPKRKEGKEKKRR